MKTKLLSVIVVSMLLIGSLALAINLTPNAKAAEPPYYLTIATVPEGIPVLPAAGTYSYDNIAWQNCTAPLEYVDGDTKYIFLNWTVTPKTDDFSPGPGQIWVHVDQNKSVTAYFKVQYKLRVETPYSTGYSEIDALGWVAHPPDRWIDAGANVHVGVPVYEKIIEPDVKKAVFDHWEVNGQPMGTDRISDFFTMDGPKSAVAFWKIEWYLKVLAGTPPPLTDPPAGSQGWYEYCTNVTLVAPDPHPTWIIPNVARWRFDYWELDGVKQEPPNPTLVVHMDKNHTATVYYRRQSFITLRDDIGNYSGIWDNGKWYDNCEVYSFNAPRYLPIDAEHRWRFVYWWHSSLGIIGYDPSIQFHVNSTSDGATLKACYHMQYYLTIKTDPPGVATIPGEGWYDAGTVISPGPTAPDIVDIVAGKSRYKFAQWVRTQPPGWSTTSRTIPSITMDQPKTFVAYYDVEFKREWYHSPSTITVPGFPGSDWQKNGTLLNWVAPLTDASGQFAFYYWVIDGVTYPQGQASVPIVHDHYIVGTAYYANKTKIFMSPDRHEETAHAYCNKFNVTIFATNFDANRLVNGEPMDIYAFDITIKWNSTLLEVQKVYKNLDEFFGFPPNGTFIVFEKLDNAAGTYRLAASVIGPYKGFEGTKAMFTLEFHVKYDPCYPDYAYTWIWFDSMTLVNHLEHGIWPELGWNNCLYQIGTVKPMLEIRDAKDGDNTVTLHTYEPGKTFFDVEVWLLNGVKVHDFYVIVEYNKAQIEAMSVVIADYLKPPYITYEWQIDKSAGKVYVKVAQDPSVPLQNCTGKLFTITFKVIYAIFYKTGGPHHLESDIKIGSGSYISVKCPSSRKQYYDTHLGAINAKYVFNPLPGDLDLDGCVTVLDLQLIRDNYGTSKYDVVTNGVTDIFDLVFVARRFGTHV